MLPKPGRSIDWLHTKLRLDDNLPIRENAILTLDQMRSGQRGRILAVVGDDPLVQRLLEMGLLEGEEVEVLGFAPFGDPMEILVRDYRLSLRRSEAARIQVTVP